MASRQPAPRTTHCALAGNQAALKFFPDAMFLLGVCVCIPYVHGIVWPLFLQSLHAQKGDVDLMRTKLRRLEEENSRKDRQIEQLLDAPRVSPAHSTCCPTAQMSGAAWPHTVFTSPSAHHRAQNSFALWRRRGPILAG